MRKTFKKIIILVLICGVLSSSTLTFSQTYTLSPTLRGYIDRASGLLNQVYYAGQTALANVVNRTDSTELLRFIDLNSTQIATLEREIINYIASIPPNTLESRNATILHITLHHFQMALSELQFFLRATTDIERFNAMQRYFYDINTALENINQLRMIQS